MFDPFDEKALARLRLSISDSSKKYESHLEHRMKFMRQVAGKHYGQKGEGAKDYNVFPLMGLALKIFSRLISSNDPRAHVHHWDPDYDPYCYELKLSLDDEFERIDLGSAANAVTVESFFLHGIMKVGRIDKGDLEEMAGNEHEIGSTYADPVLSEDFIMEMRSTRWNRLGYCGDSTRVPLEWAQENPDFRKARKSLTPTSDLTSSPFMGRMRQVRSQVLSSGEMQPLQEPYEEQVDIWNLWFPREKKILVIDRSITHVLQWKDWEGPRRGPYHHLGYTFLPGNIVPLSPMAEWYDQHMFANDLANMTLEDAVEQKQMLLVSGKNGEKDAETIMHGRRRGIVKVADPTQIKEVKFNGPDQQLWGLATMIKSNFSYFAMNMDAAGGLGPQSPTASQDKLLKDSSSQQVEDMQADVTKWLQGVMTDLTWYVRNDPTWKRTLVKNIESADLRIPFVSQPAELPGNTEDYKVTIEPYSRRNMTPEGRLAKLKEAIRDFIGPMEQSLAQRGIMINYERLLKKYAEYADLPELADILIYTQGEQERPAGDRRSSKPANTTRTNVRLNVPQTSRAGTDRTIAQLAFGGNPQEKEMASLVR